MASVVISGDTSGTATLQAQAVAGNTTLTLPTTSGNVVVDTATQTLTNKTITSPTITSPTITGAVMSSMASSIITSATAQNTTSGTTIDFTSIPSWVKRITFVINTVSTSGSSNFLMQLGTSSGITTTGYISSSVSIRTTSQQTGSTAGYVIINPGQGASESITGLHTFVNLSGNTWVSSGMNYSGTTNVVTSVGTVTLASTLTTFRLTTVNGTDTFDAGSVNILYE
jgi:hypothetical protein